MTALRAHLGPLAALAALAALLAHAPAAPPPAVDVPALAAGLARAAGEAARALAWELAHPLLPPPSFATQRTPSTLLP